MKHLISITLALAFLLVTVSVYAAAEAYGDGHSEDSEEFFCNCSTLPFEIDREKLENKEYSRVEITSWAEHMLAHSRNKGKISIPIVIGEEQGIARGDALATIVGDRGTLECSVSTVKDTPWYSYSITVSEDLIAEVFIDVLSAGIYCGCGTYHLISESFLRGDLNTDHKVNAQDYMMLKRVVLGTHTISEKRNVLADVNADGKINAQDFLMVKRHVLGTFEIEDSVLITLES